MFFEFLLDLLQVHAVNEVERLSGAKRRNASQYTQVTRQSEASDVENAISIYNNELWHEFWAICLQFVKKFDEERDLSKGEESWNVGQRELHMFERFVNYMVIGITADDESGTGIDVVVLNKGYVNAANVFDRVRFPKLSCPVYIVLYQDMFLQCKLLTIRRERGPKKRGSDRGSWKKLRTAGLNLHGLNMRSKKRGRS